jgi:transposase
LYSYVSLERRICADHPLRGIRAMVDRALVRMDGLFAAMYGSAGRPSIAPERLLRAQLLMILYSIRSERQLMEQLNYNLLYRWFVGLDMDDVVWDVTVFTKNRQRLIGAEASQQLLAGVLDQAREQDLLSDEHFSVDGTLIQAWASAQSFKNKKDPLAVALARMAACCCVTRWNRGRTPRRDCTRRRIRIRPCRAIKAMR